MKSSSTPSRRTLAKSLLALRISHEDLSDNIARICNKFEQADWYALIFVKKQTPADIKRFFDCYQIGSNNFQLICTNCDQPNNLFLPKGKMDHRTDWVARGIAFRSKSDLSFAKLFFA